MNKVILVGNLGSNPELKNLENGEKYCNVSIATNKVWKDKQTGEKKTKTSWHRLVIWGKRAEVLEKYCKAGSKLLIEGELETRSFGEGTEKKWITEVVIKDFQFLDLKSNSENNSEVQEVGNSSEEVIEDDLPF